MRFRNALHITVDNFSNVFKMLAYRVVTGILFMSLGYLVLRLGLNQILSSAEMQAVKQLIKEFFPSLFQNGSEWIQNFNAASLELLQLLGEKIDSIVGSVVGIVALFLVFRFLNGLSVFAVAGSLSDRMSIYARTSFAQSFTRNLGKAALYEVIYVPFSFLFDSLTAALCYALFFLLPSVLSLHGILAIFAALALTVTAVCVLEALKMTLITGWIPGILSGGKSVCSAFRTCFRTGKSFGRRFASYLVTNYLIITVTVLFAVCTFGSALIIVLPTCYLFVLCLQFVHYFEDNGKKYFISFRNIAGAKDEKFEDFKE